LLAAGAAADQWVFPVDETGIFGVALGLKEGGLVNRWSNHLFRPTLGFLRKYFPTSNPGVSNASWECRQKPQPERPESGRSSMPGHAPFGSNHFEEPISTSLQIRNQKLLDLQTVK
jgi:hypothetical protein